MSAQNNGGPAFPVLGMEFNYDHEVRELTTVNDGISVRDFFAAKALAALIGVPKDDIKRGAAGVPIMAKYAYEYADAMLAERAKP